MGVHGVPPNSRVRSFHARASGLRLREVLAIAHPPVLPSVVLNGVGNPVAMISQLNIR